jgi:PAS domain S-box-containing protein
MEVQSMQQTNRDKAGGDRCIILFDDKNQVIFASAGCKAVFKCGIEKLRNRPISNVFADINQKRALQSIVHGGKERVEIELRLDGQLAKGSLAWLQGMGGGKWLLFDLHLMNKGQSDMSADGPNFDSAHRERTLKNYLDDLLEASFDGIVISDEKANVVKANRAYEELSGIRKEELVGKNLKHLIEEGIIKKAVVFEVTKTRIPTTMVHSYPRTGRSAMVTGNPVFDNDGNLIYVVANFRDITQLAKMSKKLGYSSMLDFEDETLYLKTELAAQPDYGIPVRNSKMRECMHRAVHVAQFDTHVLLLGESGVGKTKIAEIIHKASPRANNPFVSINCGCIPENLLESELFGYEKGAFTGARAQGKMGQFELASGGTLVLDEIGELSLSLQVKLLKAIEEKEVLKIGGTRALEIDVRIIAVTNRDLRDMVDRKEFREDLYFRLNVVPILVPPLRERADEIPLLIKYFFDHFNRKYGTHKYPDHELLKTLGRYDHPGNVRELKNLIERIIVMSPDDLITADDLDRFSVEGETRFIIPQVEENLTIHEFLEACEKEMIIKILSEKHTLSQVAKRLGISNPTLWRKLKKHGLRKRNMIEHVGFFHHQGEINKEPERNGQRELNAARPTHLINSCSR